LQVAAANVVALLWNTYLSWASHKEVVVETASKGKKSKK
jgi:protein Mpv17